MKNATKIYQIRRRHACIVGNPIKDTTLNTSNINTKNLLIPALCIINIILMFQATFQIFFIRFNIFDIGGLASQIEDIIGSSSYTAIINVLMYSTYAIIVGFVISAILPFINKEKKIIPISSSIGAIVINLGFIIFSFVISNYMVREGIDDFGTVRATMFPYLIILVSSLIVFFGLKKIKINIGKFRVKNIITGFAIMIIPTLALFFLPIFNINFLLLSVLLALTLFNFKYSIGLLIPSFLWLFLFAGIFAILWYIIVISLYFVIKKLVRSKIKSKGYIVGIILGIVALKADILLLLITSDIPAYYYFSMISFMVLSLIITLVIYVITYILLNKYVLKNIEKEEISEVDKKTPNKFLILSVILVIFLFLIFSFI